MHTHIQEEQNTGHYHRCARPPSGGSYCVFPCPLAQNAHLQRKSWALKMHLLTSLTMLLEKVLTKSFLMCLFVLWTILSLMRKLEKLPHLGVAAGQLFENYAIFSHLKQYSEEVW